MSAVLKDPASLETIVAEWFEAKAAEVKAVEARRELDQKIVAIMRDPKKDEGTISRAVGFFKVSVTFGFDRKADANKLEEKWDSLSEVVKSAFRWKAEVATKQFKALSKDDNTVAIEFVETKPSSPSVKVEIA